MNLLDTPHFFAPSGLGASIHPFIFTPLSSPVIFTASECLFMKKAKHKMVEAICIEEVKTDVMDEGREHFAAEIGEALSAVEVSKQVLDYSGAAEIQVEKDLWPIAVCGSHSAGKTPHT